MAITVTSRDYNQNASRVRKAAMQEPVFITEHGRPATVMLSIETWHRLTGKPQSLADALSMPGLADIDFDPPRATMAFKEAIFD
jgi:prevent-host-death family protein